MIKFIQRGERSEARYPCWNEEHFDQMRWWGSCCSFINTPPVHQVVTPSTPPLSPRPQWETTRPVITCCLTIPPLSPLAVICDSPYFHFFYCVTRFLFSSVHLMNRGRIPSPWKIQTFLRLKNLLEWGAKCFKWRIPVVSTENLTWMQIWFD